MNFLNMLANDPVVMFAFGGIAITVGICAFYVYYFIKHINEDTK
jgi:NhaP-type Na+/H+ or K+/H+ antiporter